MSKSYSNTIPLFLKGNALRKRVMQIQTDSTPVEAPKDPESSFAFQLYRHFADAKQQEEMARRLRAGGTGWADVKQALYEQIDQTLSSPRACYEELMRDRKRLHRILADGAEKARAIVAPRMEKIRRAVGVR
jgi:tryptophanyl-tRNA synthetase